MKKNTEIQPLLSEINSSYENLSKNPTGFLQKKETLLKKINKLSSLGQKKECLEAMLLACFKTFETVVASQAKLSSQAFVRLKSNTIETAQELYELIKKQRKIDETGELSWAHC